MDDTEVCVIEGDSMLTFLRSGKVPAIKRSPSFPAKVVGYYVRLQLANDRMISVKLI